jgi:hypothetical protein
MRSFMRGFAGLSCSHAAVRLSALLLILSLPACISNPGLAMHSFGFDAIQDSPDIEILDYRYGDSKQPGARAPEWAVKENRLSQGASTHGEMLVGNVLYVKWKIKDTGAIHEDTVILINRLPANMKDHQIYFIVRREQLYVYLITPERRTPDMPENGPRHTRRYYKTITIYPN